MVPEEVFGRRDNEVLSKYLHYIKSEKAEDQDRARRIISDNLSKAVVEQVGSFSAVYVPLLHALRWARVDVVEAFLTDEGLAPIFRSAMAAHALREKYPLLSWAMTLPESPTRYDAKIASNVGRLLDNLGHWERLQFDPRIASNSSRALDSLGYMYWERVQSMRSGSQPIGGGYETPIRNRLLKEPMRVVDYYSKTSNPSTEIPEPRRIPKPLSDPTPLEWALVRAFQPAVAGVLVRYRADLSQSVDYTSPENYTGPKLTLRHHLFIPARTENVWRHDTLSKLGNLLHDVWMTDITRAGLKSAGQEWRQSFETAVRFCHSLGNPSGAMVSPRFWCYEDEPGTIQEFEPLGLLYAYSFINFREVSGFS